MGSTTTTLGRASTSTSSPSFRAHPGTSVPLQASFDVNAYWSHQWQSSISKVLGRIGVPLGTASAMARSRERLGGGSESALHQAPTYPLLDLFSTCASSKSVRATDVRSGVRVCVSSITKDRQVLRECRTDRTDTCNRTVEYAGPLQRHITLHIRTQTYQAYAPECMGLTRTWSGRRGGGVFPRQRG